MSQLPDTKPSNNESDDEVNGLQKRLTIIGGKDESIQDLVGQLSLAEYSPRLSSALHQDEIHQGKPSKISADDTVLFSQYAMKSKVGKVPYNPAKVNQDRGLVIPKIDRCNGKFAMFGVFDGHGMFGDDVSSFISHKLPRWFSRTKNWSDNIQESILNCFEELTNELEESEIDCMNSGTTAVVSFVNASTIYTANIGDSRAILGRMVNNEMQAIALSVDQKPDNPNEIERIKENGGRVEAYKNYNGEFVGPTRVWLQNSNTPGLAMSRSFGDDLATSVGVISVPEITETKRSENDKYLVIVSDGVSEFLSDEDMIRIVAEAPSANKACKALVKESRKQWKKQENVIDDITAVVVFL